MAYFNHAFQKMILGTKATQVASPTRVGLTSGFITDAGVASSNFVSTASPYQLGVGSFGFIDPATYKTLSQTSLGTSQRPLILAASALYASDKVGPFAGGYQETTKSKLINPKFISRFYRVDPCTANNNVIHVGKTNFTASASPPTAGCCHDFQCNTTYYLRVDVKGSPVLRYLTRNAYWTADYYTGCCATGATTGTTDPTNVMIGWANGLLGQGTKGAANFIPNTIVGPFIKITVTDFKGNVWNQPGTNGGVNEWQNYVSTWTTANSCAATPTLSAAGMTITGAYVDTVFGDCTFYPSDFFQKEPVKIFASEVDQLGNPCIFTGICVAEQCAPRQGMGFGEQVLRDLILSQSYEQNYLATNWDLRIREVTQGTNEISAVTRSAQYYRYHLLHSVPRFNNPSGVFDDDQYLLTIVTTLPSNPFETFVNAWLTNAGNPAQIEVFTCGSSCP